MRVGRCRLAHLSNFLAFFGPVWPRLDAIPIKSDFSISWELTARNYLVPILPLSIRLVFENPFGLGLRWKYSCQNMA